MASTAKKLVFCLVFFVSFVSATNLLSDESFEEYRGTNNVSNSKFFRVRI